MKYLVVAERTVRYRIVVEADDSDDAKWLVWHDPTLMEKAEQRPVEEVFGPRITIVRPVE